MAENLHLVTHQAPVKAAHVYFPSCVAMGCCRKVKNASVLTGLLAGNNWSWVFGANVASRLEAYHYFILIYIFIRRTLSETTVEHDCFKNQLLYHLGPMNKNVPYPQVL